jgi:hypothetical protein
MGAKAIGSTLSYQGVCGRHGEEDGCVTLGELIAFLCGNGKSDLISG